MLLRLLWPWFYNTPVPAQSALMRGNNNPQQKWPQFVYYDQMLGFFFKMAIEIIKILYRGKKNPHTKKIMVQPQRTVDIIWA